MDFSGLLGWVLVVIGVMSLIGMLVIGFQGGGGSAAVLFVVFFISFGLGSIMIPLPVPWADWANQHLAFRQVR